jgi:Alcohol dehydrogenase GroES-like domain/Cupin domain
MRAIAVRDRDAGVGGLTLTDMPYPRAAENDVIVRVHAASFTPGELDWPGTWSDRASRDRAPSIPGHELSGTVVELGYGTTGLTVGQRVFGLTDWTRNGSLAEYTAVEARNLAPLAADIDHTVAAALPISGLTAWQGLFDHAHLTTGRTVPARRSFRSRTNKERSTPDECANRQRRADRQHGCRGRRMRLCDGASDQPSPHGRGFGTPSRDPDISDPPGAPEHPRRNPHLGDRDPPAGRPSGAHRHGNAFVYAYVLEGAVRSQLEGEPMRTYHQGENWIEQPGAHHVATEDASNTEPAELLLVVFVVVALRDHPRTVVTTRTRATSEPSLASEPCCRAPTRFSARSATATGRDEPRPGNNTSPKEKR